MNRRLAATTLAVFSLMAAVAQAQIPQPVVPDINQRSGLRTRMMPIIPHLPPDPDRDIYANTRWAEPHESSHINCQCNGGLYGRKWKNSCTACYSPYFIGSPGKSTLSPPCEPPNHRVFTNFVHPFRPVDIYYAGGCFSPVYDLDPWVPGPGPFPFPRLYHKRPTGG